MDRLEKREAVSICPTPVYLLLLLTDGQLLAVRVEQALGFDSDHLRAFQCPIEMM